MLLLCLWLPVELARGAKCLVRMEGNQTTIVPPGNDDAAAKDLQRERREHTFSFGKLSTRIVQAQANIPCSITCRQVVLVSRRSECAGLRLAADGLPGCRCRAVESQFRRV